MANYVRTPAEPTTNQQPTSNPIISSKHYANDSKNNSPGGGSPGAECQPTEHGGTSIKQPTKSSNEDTNVIFNYSSVILSDPMKKLLNRGQNFSILPRKLDITQVFVDYKQFERSVLWKEFHHGKEDQGSYERPIFRIQKTNLPQKHNTPELLKTFLSAVKSDISDPRNRNSAECNLPI